MYAIIISAVLAVLAGALLAASAFLGSALYGIPQLSDWTLDAAQVCLWVGAAIFLGYFLAGCANEIRNMR